MKRMFVVAGLVVAGGLLLSGCVFNQSAPVVAPVAQPVAPIATSMLTYYLSTAATMSADVPNPFCDGAKMDSAGFAATLTDKRTEVVPFIANRIDLIKATFQAAAKAGGFTRMLDLSIAGDTATISDPNGAWAGVSIYLCSWKPFAEKNLLQFAEIKRVVWAE